MRQIPTPNREVDRAVFSPDGKWVAGTGRDAKAVRVWEAGTGKLAFETPAQPGGWWAGYPACAFSPDGRYFVSSDDQVLRFWDVDGWKPGGELAGFASEVVFSPDGRTLAVTSLNDVTVWEVATRRTATLTPA